MKALTVIPHLSHKLSGTPLQLEAGKPQKVAETRVKNDTNGNARRVAHFLDFVTDEDRAEAPDTLYRISWLYGRALVRAKKLGGRKFHNRQYGGGIVFQAYDGELTALAARAKAFKI